MRLHRCSVSGVALGWRSELAADLLRSPHTVDFVEVVADTCFAQPSAWREARAIAEITTVVPHGVKLSLGSAEGVDLARARRLGALARDLGAPAVTEHVAFTRAGGREIGHLTALPFTREAVRVVARNVEAARRVLPDVPLLLENVAWTFRWPDDELPEAAFYAEVAAATGCDLLLDVANLHANALNAGLSPHDALRDYPLDRVGMLHVAGGVLEGGFFLDTHAHAVPDGVFALVDAVLARTGPLPIVLERDQAFPAFDELASELERLRDALRRAPACEIPREPAAVHAPTAAGDTSRALGERQAVLARMLTAVAPPPAAAPFDATAIARTRSILRHKRIDEALPLLPRIAAAGDRARRLALRAVQQAPRASQGAGVADAWRIADIAVADPELASAAARDRLELRSRFTREAGPAGRCAPRRGPFLGRETLPGGGNVWAVKGPGREAAVRVIETGGRR